VKVVDTIEPEPEIAAKYEQRYAQFKEIYPALKPVFEIIK
jgi:xylulokinase